MPPTKKPRPLCGARRAVLRERDDSPPRPKSGRSKQREKREPTWSDFEAAIRRLDNARHTDVSLDLDEGASRTSMVLSGGNGDRVTCYVARPEDPKWDQAFRHLIDPEQPEDEEFSQVVGGQLSDLPARMSVQREVALRAARYFFEHRALAPDLAWIIE